MADFDIIARGMAAQVKTQTEQLTNQGQITGNAVMSETTYQALSTEEKENGKMYFTYDE